MLHSIQFGVEWMVAGFEGVVPNWHRIKCVTSGEGLRVVQSHLLMTSYTVLLLLDVLYNSVHTNIPS